MARLIVIRHAQAEHSNLSGCDFDRALTQKGRKDIQKTAELLCPFIIEDSICLCSSARRAEQTWQHACVNSSQNQVQYEPS